MKFLVIHFDSAHTQVEESRPNGYRKLVYSYFIDRMEVGSSKTRTGA